MSAPSVIKIRKLDFNVPPKTIDLIIKRLDQAERKLDAHLQESGEVKAKLEYHDKLLWAAVGIGGTATAGVVVQLVLMIIKGQ